MLENYENNGINEMKKEASQCVPDYENMIKKIKIKMDATIIFRDLAIRYFEGTRAKNKMAENPGHKANLHSE